MKMIATLFVVFAVVSSALGECPVPPTIPGFDIGKIVGRWYQTVESWPENATTFTLDFTLREDGDFNFTARIADDSLPAEYALAKRTEYQNVLNVTDPYHKSRYQTTINIVDTDYDNYLAAYDCFIFPHHSAIHARYVLSRTETMNADKLAQLTDLVNKIGVSRD
ncbi:apolipoprotein D [Tetranychus urticae]|uniref:Lipocalin/cytosolic fatty-acid binding domain-containing protein n=1 Tax=Tetranychus urticae TaxID=32264 RepID=T1K762_TETUR|nr:apolipoprotein D [Tetranychus urticae]